jgi:hypothetical protein
MQQFVRTDGEQSPLQWSVRWNGILCFLLLIASVPVLQLGWFCARGPDAHMVRTRSQIDRPDWQWSAIEEGSWMKSLERWLQEAAVARRTEQRRQKLVRLRERAERAGLAIVALPIPDKARVCAEFAFPGGVLRQDLQPVYGTVLADFAAAGIPTVDAWSVLQAARIGDPAQLLFHRRDAHWTLAGCMAVARALAVNLEQGPFADRLGPKVPLTLLAPMRIEVIPDLVALLGLRTWVGPGAAGPITRPASLVSSRLTEVKEYWAAGRADAAAPYEPTVAVAGSSFSVENGYEAYGWFLGRPMDHVAVWPGALPWESVERALLRAERGETKARVLVWEFLERTYGDPDWTSP